MVAQGGSPHKRKKLRTAVTPKATGSDPAIRARLILKSVCEVFVVNRMMSTRSPYPSDLTDREWELLGPLLSVRGKRGPEPSCDLRAMADGVFYVLRTGCAWRQLPHEFGPWSSVWHRFRRWRDTGTLEKVNEVLRARTRIAAGHDEDPTVSTIDSQSVGTTEKGGREASTHTRKSKGASGT